mmetsp:Transcript_18854/g.35786  ORF Transcript_18854/g.35786 Transcript_18854/m.35786 type:complete len:205 (-) Transcript_18854:97-711(-)
MRTTVNDIEARYGHGDLIQVVAGQIGKVLPQGNFIGRGTRLGDGKRNSQDGIRSQLGLVGRTIQVDQFIINRLLFDGVHTDNGGSQNVLYVLDGIQDTLAKVPIATIAQFDGLISTRRGSTGYRGTERSLLRRNFDFHGGIPTRIQNLTSRDTFDRCLQARQRSRRSCRGSHTRGGGSKGDDRGQERSKQGNRELHYSKDSSKE